MRSNIRNVSMWVGIALILPLVGTGCSDDDDKDSVTGPPTETEAFVRVAHLSPDAPSVDVWVDGTVVLEDVDYREFSGYLDVGAGSHRIQVSPANQTTPIVIDAQVSLSEGTYTTIAATGRLADIGALVLADDLSRDANAARVRFVHAGPDAPAVDITLTDGTVLFPNVEFNEAASYLDVPGGTYDLQVRVAGTETVALSFGDVVLADNHTLSVFAVGLLGDGSLAATAAVESPGDGGTTLDIAAATAEVRVAHLSPDAPNVDVYVNGSLVTALTNVPFQAVSGYLELGAATQNLQVFVAGTNTNPVIDANVTLLPGEAYTVAATGLVGQSDLTPLVLTDNRMVSPMGDSMVRFVHLSPDAPNVDITVTDGPTLFGNVAFREFTEYGTVSAGTYDLEARLTNGGALALAVPNVTLTSQANYTVFATGLAGQGTLNVVLAQDTP
ncbi:MAG: DUF4397 domain-containing protein [Candidatus Eisenbacteria bacterium]|uniref:DUF4397 domain-containing protein n=1 Tax=Eiseniibacteriota bacterium TaxID=2212470 RepID=A0A956NGS7_UNCEI|nr:DUF4397 domain-containing protein [Candidatus Eisenbacteria bacterium]